MPVERSGNFVLQGLPPIPGLSWLIHCLRDIEDYDSGKLCLKASIRPSEALSTTTAQPFQHVNMSKGVAKARLTGHAGAKSD